MILIDGVLYFRSETPCVSCTSDKVSKIISYIWQSTRTRFSVSRIGTICTVSLFFFFSIIYIYIYIRANKFHYLRLERVPVKVTFLHNGHQIPEIHHFLAYLPISMLIIDRAPRVSIVSFVKIIPRHAITDEVNRVIFLSNFKV